MKSLYLERGLIKNFDFTLLTLSIIISAIGVAAIYSANLKSDSLFLQELYIKQSVWLALALVAMTATFLVDYRTLARFAYPIFFAGIGLLLLVEIGGNVVGGSQRWISYGGLNLQPSELVKVAVIILLARILDDVKRDESIGFYELFKPAIFTLIPFAIVARQPDLGTASIYLVIFAGVAFFTGVRSSTHIKIAMAAAVMAPASWLYLKPYQKNRILNLLDPESDPMGQGYHIIQSKIAIGSGGLWGKGIFDGTQSKLNFLPEKHTDFIFSVVAEEVGFFGSIILLALMFFLIIRILDVAYGSRDRFGSLLMAGVASMLSFHILYNLGMTLGVLPIVGIPLPFISYGGSSLLTNFIAIGLALNVAMRRFQLE